MITRCLQNIIEKDIEGDIHIYTEYSYAFRAVIFTRPLSLLDIRCSITPRRLSLSYNNRIADFTRLSPPLMPLFSPLPPPRDTLAAIRSPLSPALFIFAAADADARAYARESRATPYAMLMRAYAAALLRFAATQEGDMPSCDCHACRWGNAVAVAFIFFFFHFLLRYDIAHTMPSHGAIRAVAAMSAAA